MTRTIVGGINPLDNEFYPLAVNSQGIAQIDTSGIPTPMEWEYTYWTPEYQSSDGGSAIIEYSVQQGIVYSLGAMSWFKFAIRTNNVVITDARGNLLITPPPGSTSDFFGDQTKGSIAKAKGFNNVSKSLFVSLFQPSAGGSWKIYQTSSNTDLTIDTFVPFTALTEGAKPDQNEIWGSGFFRNSNYRFRDGFPIDFPSPYETDAGRR